MTKIKEKNVVLISGLSKPMSSIGVNTSSEQIVFSGRGDIKEIITKELVTDDGRTIGERHRAELHSMLDEWLDGTWRDA